MTAPPLRALVITASVGESHGAMARSLAEQLRERWDVAEVQVRDDFSVLGRRLGRLLAGGFRVHLGHVKWTYDLAYRVFGRLPAGRRAGAAALYALGGSALKAAIDGAEPDVVLCTYPVFIPVLGMLRARGRLSCPVAAVVEPLGGLAYWVHPGVDLHVLLYPEALAEARRLAGEIRARPARPLVAAEFLTPPSRPAARAALGVASDRRLVVVSGGGWGVGDLEGAVQACLALDETQVIVAAGRNEPLRARLEQRYAADGRVTVLGFTRRMAELLSAADAFVTATAGLSCVEARLCGAPSICYGFQVGHVRDNSRALAEHGLARIAADPSALTAELARTLAAGRTAPAPDASGGSTAPGAGGLPSVADLAVALARDGVAEAAQGAPVCT